MHDMLARNEISGVMLTSSQDQLADCLTKGKSFNRTSDAVTDREMNLPVV